MGSWGIGLYSGDFAMDLRPLVKKALKLPWSIDEIVDAIIQQRAEIAYSPDEEEHTTFWLVLADQIWQAGERSEPVFRKAVDIIDSGADIARWRELGLGDTDAKKRGKTLRQLKDKLCSENVGQKRKVLRTPGKFLFSVGDKVQYPLSEHGSPRNPFFPAAALDETFQQAVLGHAIIIDVGMAFGFFPWYRPLTQRFDSGVLLDEWLAKNPGVLSRAHCKKMKCEIIGSVEISPQWLARDKPNWLPGDQFAIAEISLGNSLGSGYRLGQEFYQENDWRHFPRPIE